MHVRKGFIGIILFVVLLMILAVFGGTAVVLSSHDRLLSAEEPQYDSLALSFSDWTAFTYRDALSWQAESVTVAETDYDALAYSLRTTAEEQYVMDTSLTSPRLPLYGDNAYTFSFAYFTKMRAQTPDCLTVSVSEDGETFEDVRTYYCSKSEDLQILSVELPARAFSYLRLSLHVFYEKDDASDTVDRAFYLIDEDACLKTEAKRSLDDDFEIETSGELVYSGTKQIPSYEVTSQSNAPDTYYCTEELSGDSVLPGNYTLTVKVFNLSHALQTTLSLSYTIAKATLTLAEDSFVCLYNDTQSSVLNYRFVDETGRSIPYDELTGIYAFTQKEGDEKVKYAASLFPTPSAPFEIGIGIENSPLFHDYSVSFPTSEAIRGTGSLPYTTTSFLHDFSTDYTGEAVDFSSFVSFTGTVPSDAYPTAVEAGKTTESVQYNDKEYSFSLEIRPAVLTSVSYNGIGFSKEYDGNCDLFDDASVYVKKLDENNLSLGVEGVTVSYEKVSSARAYGVSYFVLQNPVLQGEKAHNYKLADSFYVYAAAKPTVLATSAVLYDTVDSAGNTVTVQSKTYEKGNTAAVLPTGYDENTALPVYGTDEIRYKDVSFSFSDENVGKHLLAVRIDNPSFYDRYLPDILVTANIEGTINPAVLTVEETARNGLFTENSADVYQKEYNGSVDAENLTFRRLVLKNQPSDFPAFSRFTVAYETASFEDENVGNEKSFSVIGITLVGKDKEATEYLKNYSVADITATGTIYAAGLRIYTDYVRINERQSLPVLETNLPSKNGIRNDSVLQKRIFRTLADAKTLQNEVAEAKTSEGSYFLRADSISDNYVIGDVSESFAYATSTYVILRMDVTAASKVRQTLLSDTLSLAGGNTFAMLSGGSFTPDFRSYVSGENLSTGLTVSYRIDDADQCVAWDGVTVQTKQTGSFTLTCSQRGNDYYYPADDIVITVEVLQNDLSGRIREGQESALYSGNPLPVLTEEQLAVYQKGNTVNGTSAPSEAILKDGTSYYLYSFNADTVLDSFTADYSIKGDYYVVTGETYGLADAYNAYQAYYERSYRISSVTVGETVPVAVYYEKQYAVTEDTSVKKDKVYYVISYVPMTVTADEVIPQGICYEKDGERYVRTEDRYFSVGKEYYRLCYKVADTEVGVSVQEYDTLYTEIDAYTLTHDTVFESGKTYYEGVYSPVFFIFAGEKADSSLYFAKSEDVYTPTGDGTFIDGKDYYRLYYTATDVAIDGVSEYYSQSVAYVLTEDTSFLTGKTYYYENQGHYLPLYNKVGQVRGEAYYEKVISYLLEPSPVFSGNTYFVADYKSATFLDAPVLPDSPYYVVTDLYEKTTDETFDPFTTYYTVSFDRVEAEGGTFVEGAYYTERNVTSLTDERYFDYNTLYYRATFTAKDFSSLRTVDHNYTYFIQANSFETEYKNDYYVFAKNAFVKTGAEESTFSDDTYYLPLEKTVTEFTQDTTYYYLAYPFIGSYPVSVSLHAEKPTLTVYMTSSVTAAYGEQPDFFAAVDNMVLSEGTDTVLPYDETVRLLRTYGTFSLQRGGTDFDLSRETPKTLTVLVAPAESTENDLVLTFSATAPYTVVLAASELSYTVDKATITVSLEGVTKYYGESLPDGETLTDAWRIVGLPSFETATESLLESIRYTMPFHALSSAGYYPVFLSAQAESTFADLADRYTFVFVKSFLSVQPIQIEVLTDKPSHVYGEVAKDIHLQTTILSSVRIDDGTMQELIDEVLTQTRYACAVTDTSDSGTYPVVLSYFGTNPNIIVTLSETEEYTVEKALLNNGTQDFVFDDEEVLYDGESHTLTVSYDANVWKDITVTYNVGRFTDIGTYTYTATVTKENYHPLILKAKLTIGTLKIFSSSLTIDAVTVTVTDASCTKGVSNKLSVALTDLTKSEEDLDAVKTLLETTAQGQYTVTALYSLRITDEYNAETVLPYQTYTVSLKPKNVTYSKDLVLFGYVDGKYTKLPYVYENGTYTFDVGTDEEGSVNPLGFFAFATAEEETSEFGIVQIVMIAVIVIAVVFLASLFIGAGNKAKKRRIRSKKRHQRWV